MKRLILPWLVLLTLFSLLLPVGARAQQSRNVTLLANLDTHSEYFSCWSYVHEDGREYAVLLTIDGASIVRLTDPAHPVEVAFIASAPGREWVEAVQYRHWIYLSNDIKDNGTSVIRMDDPDHPRKVATIQMNAHTLTVDDARGLLYFSGPNLSCPGGDPLCSPGLVIASLADPDHPTEIARYTTDYVHTIHVRGNLGYASLVFAQDASTRTPFAVLDLTDPSHPVEIARYTTRRTQQHSTWTSEDGRYLYAANEVGVDGATVWDVSNPLSAHQVFTFEDLPDHVIHNPVVRGNTLFTAWYTAGVRLFDLHDPAWPVEYAYYDTWPGRDGGENGAWMCAPFYPSGIFIASDTEGGLFVFRAAPPNYGIIRGTVRGALSGAAIVGAVVTVQPSGLTVKSGSDGRYAFAVPVTASATVTVSNFAYVTTSRTVAVPLGSDQTVDLPMPLAAAGTVRGTVTATADGHAIQDAELQLLGTPLRAVSDATGAYAFPSVPVGAYTLRCTRPGFAVRSAPITTSKGNTSANFALGGVSFYDDVETDRGWSLAAPTDQVQLGGWVAGVPNGTVRCDTGGRLQTDRDHTPDPGSRCFVTGNAVLPCEFFFFGGVIGVTSLTSPTLHLAGIADPRIAYWKWYIFRDSGGESHDPLVTQLSNDGGATWVTVETSFDQGPEWRFDEVRVKDFFANPGDAMIRFVARHTDPNFQPVEAAIDDIMVYAGSGGGNPAAGVDLASPRFVLGAPRPTPSRSGTEVSLALGQRTQVRANLFDIQGRLVRTLENRVLPAGSHTIRWDGEADGGGRVASGLYLLRVDADSERRILKIVVTR
jgi:choice-of-anchor B domain-containing protein